MWRVFLRKIIHRTRCEQQGSVLVLVAVLMSVMLGMSALALDVGAAYLTAGRVQTAVDAAVYAAGRSLPVGTDDQIGIAGIKDLAIHYAALNGIEGLTHEDVVLGGIYGNQYTDIEVQARSAVSFSFAKVFGFDGMDIHRSAKAMLSPVGSATGLAPLGLLASDFEEKINSGQTEGVVLKYGVGSGEGPFFGALDLDGQGGGASDYRLWLSQGYEGQVSIGDILLEERGVMTGPTFQGFQTRYDGCTHEDGCTKESYDPHCTRVIKVILYEPVPDKNKEMEVIGFAYFLLEEQDEQGYITGTFLSMVDSGLTTGETMEHASSYQLYNLVLVH